MQSGVTKHGNPRLRAALVETAWRLVRFQPDYKAVRKWRQTLAKGALATKAARKKAIVAVARQMGSVEDPDRPRPGGHFRFKNLKQ
jgi:transposase